MKIINEALGKLGIEILNLLFPFYTEIAQKCGHSQIVLVEANRGRMRSDLSAHLGKFLIKLKFYLFTLPPTYFQPTCASRVGDRPCSRPPATAMRSRPTTWSTSSFLLLVSVTAVLIQPAYSKFCRQVSIWISGRHCTGRQDCPGCPTRQENIRQETFFSVQIWRGCSSYWERRSRPSGGNCYSVRN